MQDFFENMDIEPPGWLLEESASTDVVVGAEVMALRNIADSPFCTAMENDDSKRIKSALERSIDGDYTKRATLAELAIIERFRLSERWTVPFHLVEHPGEGIFLTNGSESETVVICGLDHIMLRLAGTLEKLSINASAIQQFMDSLGNDFGWSQHPRFGYLSPNPATCGAGVIFSTICHIPAALIANRIAQIRAVAGSFAIQLRDPWAGGFDGGSSFVRLTTHALVGREPDELLANISQATEAVIEIERQSRDDLSRQAQPIIADKVMRAYGIITNAKLVENWEFNSLVAMLRLGASMGIIPVAVRSADEILVIGQQAHIGAALGESFTPMQAAMTRAQLIRGKLGIE